VALVSAVAAFLQARDRARPPVLREQQGTPSIRCRRVGARCHAKSRDFPSRFPLLPARGSSAVTTCNAGRICRAGTFRGPRGTGIPGRRP